MHVEKLRFDGHTWSKPFPALDSPSTLLVVFGASSYFDDPEPIGELVAAYPSSKMPLNL